MAIDVLHEKAKTLELQILCGKNKIPVLEGLLDETLQFVHGCLEDMDVLVNFTKLGYLVQNSGRVIQEVFRWIVWSRLTIIWSGRSLCKRTIIRISKALVLPF